ncbi:T-cell surface antigen CD2, partial [Austrofundulus limnaeus]|uniref:T-cell surface antigen CD2 n=1 Tax=Austrofundulus limnaeus TaxID=52670 RepID=A0A2I4CR41_AUSLI
MLADFNKAQEVLRDKISALQILLEGTEEKLRNRESRPEDLHLIAELREMVTEREALVKKLVDDKKFYQLELVNRETGFNKVFNSSANVGVINPLIKLKVMQMKMASVSSLTVFLLCCCAVTSQGSSDGCHLYAATGTDFTVPLEDPLDPQGRLEWKIGNKVETFRDIKKVTSEKENSLTKNGSFIIKDVKKEQSMIYTYTIFDKDYKQKFTKARHLCVLDPVSKPTLKMECKEPKVIFTCVIGQQPEDRQIHWLKDGEKIENTKLTLEIDSSESKLKKFSCQVFNKVSSKTSETLTHNCIKHVVPGIPEEVFGISIWIFVGCGGGVVLVLIIFVIVCCVLRKRKRSMHLKEEEELRLQWLSAEQQNH